MDMYLTDYLEFINDLLAQAEADGFYLEAN
jgi:hypothetical protein